jgi:hypothetical protein
LLIHKLSFALLHTNIIIMKPDNQLMIKQGSMTLITAAAAGAAALDSCMCAGSNKGSEIWSEVCH